MNKNPLAKAIRRVFEKNIVNTAYYFPGSGDNSPEGRQKKQRIDNFIKAINGFLQKSGLAPCNTTDLQLDERKLIHFALQLSGYIRDAQKELHDLQDKYACDPDLIELYQASAHYTVACSGKVPGNKYVFEENKDYCFWKVENPQHLDSSAYTPVENGVSLKPCLIMAMPFHIKPTPEELQKWSYLYMHDSFENRRIFGSEVDVYLAHFPIEQPRGEKFSLALRTIRDPQNFYADTDMRFVVRHFSPLIGKDLQFDRNYRIVDGQPYSPETFKQNMARVTILGYCAGTHHAHRWINAVERLAGQLYSEKDVKQALSNVFVITYAALPMLKENKYSGAHFMSNFENDQMRKEPFIKMFRPQMYEQVKYTGKQAPARITAMPDHRNFIIAHKLAPQLDIIDRKSGIITIPNPENGHHIGFITTPNLSAEDNFPYYQFRTVLENAALGKRGLKVFEVRNFDNADYVLKSYAALAARKDLGH